MKLNKWIMASMYILVFFTLVGCMQNKNVNSDNDDVVYESENESEAIDESPADVEAIMNKEELEDKLLQAYAIELKDIENRTIGMLKEGELITDFVRQLCAYPVKGTYVDYSEGDNEVVGPINFYFSGEDSIYGLVKENYIYIEGHYFIIDVTDVKNIQDLFKSNVVEGPAVGE